MVLTDSDKLNQLDFIKKRFEPTKDFYIGPALDLTFDYFIDKSLLSLVYGHEDKVSDFSTTIMDSGTIWKIWDHIVELFLSIDFGPEATACFCSLAKILNINIEEITNLDKSRPFHAVCQLVSHSSSPIKVNNGHKRD